MLQINRYMKIALVLTVKNEERLLRANLLYHHAIGASHVFVYFDGATDNGKAAIADLDFVTSTNSVASTTYEHLSFLNKFTSQANEHHTARQCLNTYHAFQQCEEKGYDWLISIDADELVCTSINEISNLEAFFSEIAHEVDVVQLQTREVLQRQIHYPNVMAQETLFKARYTYQSRFKNIYKKLFNPFTKEHNRFSYWYGQHLGKGAVRVSSNVIPHNVHTYKMADGNAASIEKKGLVLHYHAYDAQDFIKKFTNFSNHPNTFLSGSKVESIKLLLRDIVNHPDFTKEDLHSYFKKNILFSTEEVQSLKRNRYAGFFKRNPPPLQEITSVQKVFETKIDIH